MVGDFMPHTEGTEAQRGRLAATREHREGRRGHGGRADARERTQRAPAAKGTRRMGAELSEDGGREKVKKSALASLTFLTLAMLTFLTLGNLQASLHCTRLIEKFGNWSKLH